MISMQSCYEPGVSKYLSSFGQFFRKKQAVDMVSFFKNSRRTESSINFGGFAKVEIEMGLAAKANNSYKMAG